MKRSFVYITIITICTSLIGQDLYSKYKYLAEYSILNYTLTDNGSNQHLSILPSKLNRVNYIINNNDFRYRIELIDKLGEYEFILITDSTNFQLHGLHQNIWAVNSKDSFLGNCINLNELNIEKFVNQYLYESISKYDKLSIIRIYNKIELGGGHIVFFNQAENIDLFDLLYDEYKLNNDNRLNKLIKSTSYYDREIYTYETFYRENFEDTINYYHLMFEFNWDEFKVTKTLLYKIRV